MIFDPELAQRVLTGEKTQTRWIVKPGEYLYTSKQSVKMVVTKNEAIKWQVSQTYAIQPGRGKAAIGRVKLLDIRREWVRDISEADAIAEGVELNHYYCDEGVAPDFFPIHRCHPIESFLSLFERIGGKAALDKEVWVLVFEVVK